MTAWNIRSPTWLLMVWRARKTGHQQRTDRRRGAQDAEAERAGLQDVGRIDRQQRHDAAEQHREQIERDGAEDRRIVADEFDAGIDVVRRCVLFRRHLRDDKDAAGQDGAQQPEHHGERIWQARRCDVSKSAERRAGDDGDLRRAA
jgi:hypothetical protein